MPACPSAHDPWPDSLLLHVPAAGVAEPSTMVIVPQPHDRYACLLNSRIDVPPPPPFARLNKPILPPYISYAMNTADLSRDDTPDAQPQLSQWLALRRAIAQLRDAGVPCRRFVVCGAPQTVQPDDPEWQILADVLASKIHVRVLPDAAARGEAIMRMLTHTTRAMSVIIKSMAQWTDERIIRPDRTRARQWREL